MIQLPENDLELLPRIDARRESALDDSDANLAALLWDCKDIITRQQKCIDLMLYYVNSDSTWESLQDQLQKILSGKDATKN